MHVTGTLRSAWFKMAATANQHNPKMTINHQFTAIELKLDPAVAQTYPQHILGHYATFLFIPLACEVADDMHSIKQCFHVITFRQHSFVTLQPHLFLPEGPHSVTHTGAPIEVHTF